MQEHKQKPLIGVNTQGALDLSKLTEKKLENVKILTTPDLKVISEADKEKFWNTEMQHIAAWMKLNAEAIDHDIETDIVRKMYTKTLTNEIYLALVKRVGISPTRIPAPVISSFYQMIHQAMQYGIYKGAMLAEKAHLQSVPVIPAEQLPLDVENEDEQVHSEPESDTKKQEG